MLHGIYLLSIGSNVQVYLHNRTKHIQHILKQTCAQMNQECMVTFKGRYMDIDFHVHALEEFVNLFVNNTLIVAACDNCDTSIIVNGNCYRNDDNT